MGFNNLKFKAEDISHANQGAIIISLEAGACVYQGLPNGTGDTSKFTIISGQRKYEFTVDFSGEGWANAVMDAATASPGGSLAVVQRPSGASKISDFVISG